MSRLRTLRPMVRVLDSRTVRPPARQKESFYGSPQHRDWSAKVIARAGGQCEAMEDGFRCTKAKPAHRMYADHIVEIRDGGSRLDLNNGRCLCASHHEIKTVAVRQARGWSGSLREPTLPRPHCRVMLICGPPASGKSTYVHEHAKADDIVIDLDVIARDRGLGRNRPANTTSLLLWERNNRLSALAKEPAERTAWVILTAPDQKMRQWWCKQLAVQPQDMVLLLPSRAELHRRVINDPERKRIADLQIHLIDQWLMRETGIWPA